MITEIVIDVGKAKIYKFWIAFVFRYGSLLGLSVGNNVWPIQLWNFYGLRNDTLWMKLKLFYAAIKCFVWI